MSNRFGINSAGTTGDNNPTVADASETETTQKPFTGLNFNSVVSSSFNSALTDADQVLKTQAAAPKPDNSSFLSMGGSFMSGTATGLAEQVTTIFKKDKATLAREADQGGISALSSGHSISASFTRTAGEVAHAVPALNPLTADGRKNLGILKDKYVEGWTTGTADDKARFAGTNFSFILTLGVGGGNAAKSTANVARDLRGGTMATRALGLADNVAGVADDVGMVGRRFAHVGEKTATRGHTLFTEAKAATAVAEGVVPRATTVTGRLTEKGAALFQDAKVATASLTEGIGKRTISLTDRVGLTGPTKASTLRVGEAVDGNLFKSLQVMYKDARPASFTSTAITDFSKATTTKAINQFDNAVSGLMSKGESPLLQEVKSATEALLAKKPGAHIRFSEAIAKSGNAELAAHGNQILRSVERAGSIEHFGLAVDDALKSAGTKLQALKSGLTIGSDGAKSFQTLERLMDDAARGGTKTDDLVQAVNALKRDVPGLNPKLVDGLVADITKLESATTNRRLLTALEGAAAHADEAAGSFERVLQQTRSKTSVISGSDQFKAFENLKGAADDLAHGKISPEQFATKIDDLKKAGNIDPKLLETVTQEAAKLTERVSVANMFDHMSDLVKPVKAATAELDNVLLSMSKESPEQVAKVRQAFAEFAAGRSGSTEGVTTALRELVESQKSVGGDIARVTKLGDDLVHAVEKARPALTMEKAMAESTPVLEEALRRWAGNPQQVKAIQEVQTAFAGALKGSVTADELAQVISKNSSTFERVAKGSGEILKVNGARIADAAVDSSRAIAIKNGLTDLGKASEEILTAVKGLKTQFVDDATKTTALTNFQKAVNAFKTAPTHTDDLTTKLQTAIKEAREAGIPFSKHMDEFANTVERTSKLQTLEASVVKTRQVSNNVIEATSVMEAALKQSDSFQAIERLRNAARSGDPTKIKQALDESAGALRTLDEVQPGFSKIVREIAEGGRPTNKQLASLNEAIDGLATAARRHPHPDFKGFQAIDEIRAAAGKTAVDGIGDDLAKALKKHEASLISMQERVAAMEARVAGVEPRATNLVKGLNDDAKLLADEASKVRHLNNVENASRSITNVINKVEDAARITGIQTGKDVRTLAASAGDDLTRTRLIAEAERLEAKTSQLSKEIREMAAAASDDLTRNKYTKWADDLNANPGRFNAVSERLSVFKSATDDFAKGAIKESGFTEFAKRSSAQLDDAFGKGTGKLAEARVAELANAQKLSVARDSIEAARQLPKLADQAANLGTDVQQLAAKYDLAIKNLAHNNGTLDEVNAAAQKLRDFKGAEALKESVERMQKTAHAMDEARWAAFEGQFKAYDTAARLNSVSSFKTTLNHIANMYDVMPPAVQEKLLKLREQTINAWAAKLIQEQGFYGPNTIAQKVFGGLDGGQALIARIQNGSFNVKPVAGLETSKSQLLEAAERFNNNITANQVKFGVRGLTQDRAALMANPNLAQEAMTRKLRNDVLKAAAGYTAFGLGAYTLHEKAQDAVYDELNAPYKIAEWMEKEISAKTDADRAKYRAELATMVADYIRNKDQSEIDALREQIKNIIAERTAENPQAQAVWTRHKEALSIGQLRVNKEHENQVQYGNPHGPSVGPGTPAAVQEVAQQAIVTPPARVRSTSVSNVDQDGNKRKPATTNFDINKIKDMSNNIAYSQSSLRANPMGTAGQASLANAYTPGSTKAWQNVVSWNTGR
ncbi:MAG: hypothetical protein IT342_03775, partial [Candidatus Melainabacteria bacterium]|nr:hypothetical protein [Candidatus Melainabacteria bacterium]